MVSIAVKICSNYMSLIFNSPGLALDLAFAILFLARLALTE